tara:strand:+ start:354 stop:518 length:165 start_codon:yes stop_codon:yes gene_type:complete
MDFIKSLENVKKQQEQAKELFLKCQGAIELLEDFIKEQKSSKIDNVKGEEENVK